MGISNQEVEKYFLKHKVKYRSYVDGEEESPDFANLLKDIDYLIKSPGIKMDRWLIVAAQTLGIEIINDLELFYLLKSENKYICVTGTNGKTTVVTYLGLILKQLNINHFSIGNIGTPCFSVIDDVKADDLLVVEASSYMLETCHKFRPNVLAITNIFPHHLDHHGSFQEYFNAKLKIANRMREADLIIYPDNNQFLKKALTNCKAQKHSFSYSNDNASGYYLKNTLVFKNAAFYFPAKRNFSKHDQLNFLTSMMIIYSLYNKEYNLSMVVNKIELLKKPPYRFELILNKSNLKIYNDSKATNPFATIASLQEVIYQKRTEQLILIGGGEIQPHNYQVLKVLLNKVDQIYLYGANRFVIKDAWKEDIASKINLMATLPEVMEHLSKVLTDFKQTTILFSPMSSSFDQFSSYEERGKVFNELVKKFLE